MANYRKDSELRDEDVRLSDNIYSLLDKKLYSTQTTNFERVNDKTRQVKGIDVIFDIGEKHYIADEKAAVRYRNIKTFTLELSFINKRGEIQDGWLIDEHLINNSYVLVWIDNNESGEEFATVALVMKNNIRDYLNKLGWTKSNLVKKMNLIREGKDTNMGDLYRNGCKFIFSTNYVEQPINIQLPRDTYLKLADKTWKIRISD